MRRPNFGQGNHAVDHRADDTSRPQWPPSRNETAGQVAFFFDSAALHHRPDDLEAAGKPEVKRNLGPAPSPQGDDNYAARSEESKSELLSLLSITYPLFLL